MDEIWDHPAYLIRRLRQIATAVQMEEFERFGVTPLQYGVLLVLSKNPGVDQVTLAGIFAHNQSTIGGVIARLTKRGLVVRKRGVEDRRSWVLYLAPEGQILLRKLIPIGRRAQKRILDPLSGPQRKRFMALMTKIIDGNGAASRNTILLAK